MKIYSYRHDIIIYINIVKLFNIDIKDSINDQVCNIQIIHINQLKKYYENQLKKIDDVNIKEIYHILLNDLNSIYFVIKKDNYLFKTQIEYYIMKQLSDNNGQNERNKYIIPIIGYDPNIGIIMPYSGINLLQLIKLCRTYEYKLVKPQIYNILYQICKGLSYIHRNNIIHGDIKSSNILINCSVNNKLNVKICDFGLSTTKSNYDNSPYLIYTEIYRPPECWLFITDNINMVDFTSDIWPLGIIMIELFKCYSLHDKKCDDIKNGRFIDKIFCINDYYCHLSGLIFSSNYINFLGSSIWQHINNKIIEHEKQSGYIFNNNYGFLRNQQLISQKLSNIGFDQDDINILNRITDFDPSNRIQLIDLMKFLKQYKD